MKRLGRPKHAPLARSQGLLIEEVDSEKVIFDEETKKAHCLTPVAAVVFAHCDGKTSPADLAGIASDRLGESVGEEEVENALGQLQERDLLESQLPIRLSRRDMFHKGAALGAAAAAATLVFTVDPSMAQAAGHCTSIHCTSDSNCSGGSGCSPLSCHCPSGTGSRICHCSG